MLLKSEDILELIYNEREKWYGDGDDCHGAETALDNVIEQIKELIPYEPRKLRGRR